MKNCWVQEEVTTSFSALLTVAASLIILGIVICWAYYATYHEDVEAETPNPPAVEQRKTVEHLIRFEDETSRQLARCLGEIPLYQHEWEAYTSLADTIGVSAFCHSTLLKQLKMGNYAAACDEIKRWDKVDGKVVDGLVTRRRGEYARCMGEMLLW